MGRVLQDANREIGVPAELAFPRTTRMGYATWSLTEQSVRVFAQRQSGDWRSNRVDVPLHDEDGVRDMVAHRAIGPRVSQRQSGDSSRRTRGMEQSWRSSRVGVPWIGTAPAPCLRRGDQACLHGIEMNVFNRLHQVVLVADIAVPILAVPDGMASTGSAIAAIFADLAGRELLPRSNDFRHRPSMDWLK